MIAEKKCSSCQRITTTELSPKLGYVSQVLDYKERKFDAPGFPQGGTVTIQGWRLNGLSEFTTVICRDCIEAGRKEYEAKRKKRAARLRGFARVLGAAAAAVAILAALLFVAKTAITMSTTVNVPAVLAGVAALCCVIALGCYFDAKNYDANHVKEFDPKDPARHLHEKVLIEEARIHIPPGAKNILGFSERESRVPRSARPGDVLVHRDEITNLLSYPTGGGWSLIWATWKTHGSSDISAYNPELLNQSMTNQGFKNAGEFLNAK